MDADQNAFPATVYEAYRERIFTGIRLTLGLALAAANQTE